MAARSTGIFPRKASWVDLAASTTVAATNSADISVVDLRHSDMINCVAYFNASAAGTVEVKSGSTVLFTMDAPANGGKVQKAISGFELADAAELVTVDGTALTTGEVQVSLY